jgi:2-dehydro-3-deoxyphosphogluconate aldolase / (4S)-4-hydroxy-2-oxoglutarate aldolase
MPEASTAAALRRSGVADLVRATRLIAVLRRVEPQARLLDLVDDLAADGVRIFEVTFDAPTAADDLVACRARLATVGRRDAVVGAGTVVTTAALEEAAAAGAAFVVGPTLDAGIVERAVGLGMPVIPGAYTPTEIDLAWRTGATFVKVFPASSLGPAHVRELRGPFPGIEMIATGGVDVTNARAFLDAGCVAVGMGGALVRADAAERRALVASVAPVAA